MRVSEYTCPGAVLFSPDLQLSPHDVQINFHRRLAYIHLKASKTAPFRVGACVRLGTTNYPLCPVSALIRYLAIRGNRPGSLFLFENGRYLTRQHVSSVLRRSLGASVNVNTHSLRIGGASALAAVNTPDYVIQLLGRWRSDAFREYIALPDAFITARQVQMAAATTITSWDPDTGSV